jgi:hypothetical protein
MPSPFPGMDPYLEHREIFPDFHDGFIAYLREAIQGRLPEPYYAALGRRAWIEVSERYVGPDVNVIESRRPFQGHPQENGPVAVASQTSTQPVVIHVPHDERRETLVEIYVGRGTDRRLVTAIEMLSLTNKTAGHHGRDLYRRKQQELLEGEVHLLEIDLLRDGLHTTAVPHDRLVKKVGSFDYHICLHRFDNLEDFFVYTVRIEQPLPEIIVPLLPGHSDISIDLQAVFTRAYDAGPYRREIDYARDELQPSLPPDQMTWVREILTKPA